MSHEEKQEKVILTIDDVNNIEAFFNHFKLVIPERLQKGIDLFKKDPKRFTLEDQRRFAASYAAAFYHADHPLLQGKLFEKVREKCIKASYTEDFKDEIKDILAQS